jgi:NAD-dependent SIR2 family protein deacetylase
MTVCSLRDKCLDWDDQLPEYDLEMARKHSREASLSICIGTSLQMQPAMQLPVMATYKYKKPVGNQCCFFL